MLSTLLLSSAFVLTVPFADSPFATPSSRSLIGDPISLVLDGVLEPSDRESPGGTWVDDHVVELRTGQLLILDLAPSGFAGRVRARSPEGVVFEATGREAGEAVRLELWAPVSGAWTLEVTAANAGQGGGYTLAIDVEGDALVPDAWPAGFVESGWLGEEEDDVLASGEFFDVFVLDGRGGDLVELDVRAAFVPYLALVAPGGDVVQTDGEPEVTGGSRIYVRLPASGRYTIAVTSDAPHATGAYTLKIVVDRPDAVRGERLRVT